MMTDVIVVPSLEGLLVGCVLLTGRVAVVVIALSVCDAEVTPTLWEKVVFNSVHKKHTSQSFHIAINDTKEMSILSNTN